MNKLSKILVAIIIVLVIALIIIAYRYIELIGTSEGNYENYISELDKQQEYYDDLQNINGIEEILQNIK